MNDIDPADLARLGAAIEATGRTAREGLSGALKQAAVFAVQSAAKATPLGKKTRKFRDVRRMSRKRRRADGIPWWAKYKLEWKGGEILIPENILPKLKHPIFRGAARSGWWQSLRGFGKSTPVAFIKGLGLREKLGKLETRTYKGALVEAIITNKVRYISTVAPTSAARGIQAAASRLEKIELKRVERQIKREWDRHR